MKKKPTSQSAPARRNLGEGGFFILRVLIKICAVLAIFFPAYGATAQEALVARYNSSRNLNDGGYAVAVDASGNVYVTGFSNGSNTGADYATIKYNASGTQQWVAVYNGPGNGNDIAFGIAVDGSGNVYVTGYSAGSGTGYDCATIKYDASGSQKWVARYNGPVNGNDYGSFIAIDGSGNVYITGQSAGSGTGRDYITIKYDASGGQKWAARYNGPVNGDDTAQGLAVDGSGNVYVTGRSAGSGTGCYPVCEDYATIKYNASGVQQWVAQYNGPGNSEDFASAMAIDASGNVYVTGTSTGSGTNWDYATIKYDTSGTQQWVARYNGPGNSNDAANAIAIDGSGNVYVTGQSGVNQALNDYATVKYNPSGTQQWVASYKGPGNDSDVARRIAVDGFGNIFVTGWSTGSGTDYDYATIKYNAFGTQQWVDRYNGPGNGGDTVEDIAVDNSGNVYVTGSSFGSGTDYDFATIKYLSCWPTCRN